jgi:diphthine synthase
MGLVRIGTSTQKITSGPLKSFLDRDMGEPMHSFIICGTLHDMEQEMYNFFLNR